MPNNVKKLQNKTFGRLLVLELDHLNPNEKNLAYWKCKCSCGNIIITRGTSLTNGNTISCGCYQKELASKVIKKEIIKRTLSNGVAASNDLYRQYKKNAKKRNIEFDLSYEQFISITSMNCDYCGRIPSTIHYNIHWNGNYIFNGIDRIDNKKGYIIYNVVPCCKYCNMAKMSLSENEFLELIKNIFYHKKLYLN